MIMRCVRGRDRIGNIARTSRHMIVQRGSGTVGRESGRGKHGSRVHEQREKGSGKAEDKDVDSGYTGQEAATVTVVKQAGNRKKGDENDGKVGKMGRWGQFGLR